MDIRFVLPSEVEQLARNVVTSFPSKTPAALLQNMEGELHRPDEGRYLGCFDDDGTLVGSLLMMDLTFLFCIRIYRHRIRFTLWHR